MNGVNEMKNMTAKKSSLPNGTLIDRHVFVFNEKENGGEQLSLMTEFFANGDPGVVYTNQCIRLQSYCNCASIDLSGVEITSALLRKLADELDERRIAISASLRRTEMNDGK